MSLSRVRLFVTPWTAACQAPLSMGFSKQEYWSGLPCPPPGDLPNPGIEPRSPTLQVDSLLSEPPGKPKNIDIRPITLQQPLSRQVKGRLHVSHLNQKLDMVKLR